MKDIVFPKDNEEEFIKLAQALGTKNLLFVYPKETAYTKKTTCKITTAVTKPATKIQPGKHKAPLVIKSNQQKDRWVIEKVRPSIIYGFEFQDRKDFLHHRNSALNHILAKLMAKNNIAYGFPVADLINAPKWKQPIILGRMQQNIALCQKYGVEIIIASFAKDPMDMRSIKDMQTLLL